MQRTVNRAGLELMQRLHTFRPKAVKNADGHLTVGFGHTFGVKEGDEIDLTGARRFLVDDMATYARFVTKIVKVPLTENQFSSLTVFCAHVSAYIFERTDLVRLLNRGWYEQVPAQLRKWAAKQTGIHRVRRSAEIQLWITPDEKEAIPDIAA